MNVPEKKFHRNDALLDKAAKLRAHKSLEKPKEYKNTALK
jgi:hypothetical protein